MSKCALLWACVAAAFISLSPLARALDVSPTTLAGATLATTQSHVDYVNTNLPGNPTTPFTLTESVMQEPDRTGLTFIYQIHADANPAGMLVDFTADAYDGNSPTLFYQQTSPDQFIPSLGEYLPDQHGGTVGFGLFTPLSPTNTTSALLILRTPSLDFIRVGSAQLNFVVDGGQNPLFTDLYVPTPLSGGGNNPLPEPMTLLLLTAATVALGLRMQRAW